MAEQKNEALTETPTVSVIMPVFNGGQYLHDAITSILNQTFEDYELLIVNDGSTDNSMDILNEFAEQDSRIRIFSRSNHGLIKTLNFALNHARGELIARMDADDISSPTRLAEQVQFFAMHRDIAIVGTGYEYIDNTGNKLGRRQIQTEHENIVASFFFGNPIAHPSVMLHRDRLPMNWQYDCDYEGAEDLALWLVLSHAVKFANLPEPLLQYRISGQSQSDTKQDIQWANACKAIYLNTHLHQLKSGAQISQELYNRRGGFTAYPRFLWRCVQLTYSNAFTGDVPIWPLLKRTMAAQIAFFKTPLRQTPLHEE
ncbi:glycosyltransferase family 2 protein [Thalassotalea litorea]|nr:glycosyltransferase [Thalassotalea litorea]